jgi:L-lysine 2,3-aminomutase
MDENDETTNDVSAGLKYIAEHPQVTNVLLTGGDPLLMSTRRLIEIFERLREIPHVRIIRIGSKMPAFERHFRLQRVLGIVEPYTNNFRRALYARPQPGTGRYGL